MAGGDHFDALSNFGALRDNRLRDGSALLNALSISEQAISLYCRDLKELARAVG
jgi:hypothetical protein